MTRIYVGNLPFDATEDAVRALFAAHGVVEKMSLITDRDTGRPKGFGFVEMSNADASRAMQALDGTDFGGRPLKVNEAQARPAGGGAATLLMLNIALTIEVKPHSTFAPPGFTS